LPGKRRSGRAGHVAVLLLQGLGAPTSVANEAPLTIIRHRVSGYLDAVGS